MAAVLLPESRAQRKENNDLFPSNHTCGNKSNDISKVATDSSPENINTFHRELARVGVLKNRATFGSI